MSALGIRIEVSEKSLKKLRSKVDGPMLSAFLKTVFEDLTHYAEQQTKDRTPWVTGNLRRSIQSDVRNAGRLPNPETSLGSDEPYVWWIEFGEDTRGRKLQTKPGGYRMFHEGGREAAGQVSSIIDSAVRELESAWGS